MTRFLEPKMTFGPPKQKAERKPINCDHRGWGSMWRGDHKWHCIRCNAIVDKPKN